MKLKQWMVAFIIAILFLFVSVSTYARQCPPEQGVALQVLGSGGPIADDARASTAYVIWVDGKSRVLIDAGSGSFLRFGEASARFSDLEFIGISHFHTDHSADLPALLKSGSFFRHQGKISIAGPGGDGRFPGLKVYLNQLLNSNTGAYAYLSGYLDGTEGLPILVLNEVGIRSKDPVGILGTERSDIQVDAMPVPHGIVPALAYRVRVGTKTIVFSGDQNGTDKNFVGFAKNATILVMHMPVPQGATGVMRRLHAPPGVLASIATESGAETLLLSHFMARSLQNLETSVELIENIYTGKTILANDLDCYSLN